MSCSVCMSICLPPAAAFHPYCPQGLGNNFRRKYTQSRVICQSVVVKVASHVCKSWVSAPVIPLFHCHGCRSLAFALVVLHIELHGCRSRVFAPVGFNECCPELRQVPAPLRVLRNSPRAMPLFGLPIIVMFARYNSRKQGKLQRACAYGGPEIHGCRFGSFAPVIPLFHCHGCRSWVLPPSALMNVVLELRQEPAQLRVLRNSPRAMPLFGLPIIVVVALYTSRKQGKL